MKTHFKIPDSRMLRLVQTPGVIRLMLGVTLLSLFLSMAAISEYYQAYLAEKRGDAVSLTFSNQPPSIAFFRSILAPDDIIIEDQENFPDDDPFALPEAPTETVELFTPLGADLNGNDLLGKIMQGARTAVLGSLLAVLLAIMIGVPAGVVAGYYGGQLDRAIRTVMSTLAAFPKIVVLVIVAATLGFNFVAIMSAIGILASAKISDIIREKILALKETQFIEAARELGLSDFQIIFKHILWYNCRSILIIQLAYEMAEAILLECSLSFMNVGIKGQISWGKLLYDGTDFIYAEHYWKLFFPIAAIVISISALLLFADGLKRLSGNSFKTI